MVEVCIIGKLIKQTYWVSFHIISTNRCIKLSTLLASNKKKPLSTVLRKQTDHKKLITASFFEIVRSDW